MYVKKNKNDKENKYPLKYMRKFLEAERGAQLPFQLVKKQTFCAGGRVRNFPLQLHQ